MRLLAILVLVILALLVAACIPPWPMALEPEDRVSAPMQEWFDGWVVTDTVCTPKARVR
jgi:hypothetical protein